MASVPNASWLGSPRNPLGMVFSCCKFVLDASSMRVRCKFDAVLAHPSYINFVEYASPLAAAHAHTQAA